MDTVPVFFPAVMALICAITFVRGSSIAAVDCKQRYKFMEISI